MAMRFDLITIFPEFFAGPLDHGIVRRAREAGLIHVHLQDLRSFTHDRHRTVDDRPFGGGEGMVLKPEPLAEGLESLGIGVKAQRTLCDPTLSTEKSRKDGARDAEAGTADPSTAPDDSPHLHTRVILL